VAGLKRAWEKLRKGDNFVNVRGFCLYFIARFKVQGKKFFKEFEMGEETDEVP